MRALLISGPSDTAPASPHPPLLPPPPLLPQPAQAARSASDTALTSTPAAAPATPSGPSVVVYHHTGSGSSGGGRGGPGQPPHPPPPLTLAAVEQKAQEAGGKVDAFFTALEGKMEDVGDRLGAWAVSLWTSITGRSSEESGGGDRAPRRRRRTSSYNPPVTGAAPSTAAGAEGSAVAGDLWGQSRLQSQPGATAPRLPQPLRAPLQSGLTNETSPPYTETASMATPPQLQSATPPPDGGTATPTLSGGGSTTSSGGGGNGGGGEGGNYYSSPYESPGAGDGGVVAASIDMPPSSAPSIQWVRLEVHDQGVGITPSEATYLFRTFSQVGVGRLQASKGSGLGLFICHQIVQRLGGRMGVSSTAGSGSCFYAELPLGTVMGPSQPPPPPSSSGGAAAASEGGEGTPPTPPDLLSSPDESDAGMAVVGGGDSAVLVGRLPIDVSSDALALAERGDAGIVGAAAATTTAAAAELAEAAAELAGVMTSPASSVLPPQQPLQPLRSDDAEALTARTTPAAGVAAEAAAASPTASSTPAATSITPATSSTPAATSTPTTSTPAISTPAATSTPPAVTPSYPTPISTALGTESPASTRVTGTMLSAKPPRPGRGGEPASEATPSLPAGLHLLVVDDDAPSRHFLAKALKRRAPGAIVEGEWGQ